MSRVILLPRNVPAIPRLDERGIPMPQLVSNDGQGIPLTKGANRVGVPPVVQRGLRESKRFAGRFVSPERGTFEHSLEDNRVICHRSDVLSEDVPRPQFGRTNDAVPPRGLAASGVDRSSGQINVSTRQSLHDLPLNPGGGHKGTDSPVRHGERSYECFRLFTVKPDKAGGVRFVARNVSDDVMRNHIALYEPLSEDRKRCAIAILRASRTIELGQELAHTLLREGRSREREINGDQATDLRLVLGPSLPTIDQRREVRRAEPGKELIESISLEGIINIGKPGPLLEDDIERRPVSVVLEGLDHALQVLRHFLIRGATREGTRLAIGESDPKAVELGVLGLVSHGENLAQSQTVRQRQIETTLTESPKSMEYPGGGSNPYDLWSRDFETVYPSSAEELNAHPYSSDPTNSDQPHPSTTKRIVKPFATSHGLSRVRRGE